MNQRLRVAGRFVSGTVVVLAATMALVAAPARADVQPGDTIGPNDVDKIKDLVSPGMQWCVRHGWPMRIVESQKIPWPKKYKEATEKYSAQTKLAPDGLTLKNYVAGQPFTELDANDPKVATKVMWNYEYKWLITDDVDLRNFDADTGTIGKGQQMSVERHFLLDHFRILRYIGRLHNDPQPIWETDEGYQSKNGLYPVLEPYDLKGVGGITFRYIDPSKQDDTWLYLPSLRRVRRLSTAQRSDALFGQDTDVDSYYGYAGHIAWMDWSLIGEQEILGTYHAENYPVKWAEPENWAYDDVWEKRDAWVVEGRSKLSQYAYSKRVIYIDKETYSVAFSDMYDRGGQLWKIWINQWAYQNRPFPGVDESNVYDYDAPFLPSIVMVDMQLTHATKAALPSHRYPGEVGWYFNKGEKAGVTEDWFTVANLIASGR